MLNKIYIITPCSRHENLQYLADSILFQHVEKWIIVYDRPKEETFKFQFQTHKHSDRIVELICTVDALFGNACRNMGIDYLVQNNLDGFLFFLDDDNLVHPRLWELPEEGLDLNKVYTFDMQRSYNENDLILGDNPVITKIDTAMILVHSSMLNGKNGTSANIRWNLPEYCADGRFIEEIVSKFREHWVYLPGVRAYWNRLKYTKTAYVHISSQKPTQ